MRNVFSMIALVGVVALVSACNKNSSQKPTVNPAVKAQSDVTKPKAVPAAKPTVSTTAVSYINLGFTSNFLEKTGLNAEQHCAQIVYESLTDETLFLISAGACPGSFAVPTNSNQIFWSSFYFSEINDVAVLNDSGLSSEGGKYGWLEISDFFGLGFKLPTNVDKLCTESFTNRCELEIVDGILLNVKYK